VETYQTAQKIAFKRKIKRKKKEENT